MFRRVTAVLLAVALGCVPALAAGGPYDQTVSIALPADGRVSFGDHYHHARGGGSRVHKATDLMGAKLWKLYAAVDGEVCHLTGVRDPMPSWGYSLTICGGDGREYRYIHLNNDHPGTNDGLGGPEWAYAPGIRRGATVRRGQFVGYMGDSGNAEGTQPHLHFEIHDETVTDPYGDHRINPYPSLAAARARGEVPADPGEPARDGVLRVAGADRVGTAVALSRHLRASAPHVVLTPAERFPETLAAGPLAATLDAVVLPTWGNRLDARVAEELARLRPAAITLVGGMELLHSDVARAAATAAGLPLTAVRRVAGADRFGTAAAVAREVWALTPQAPRDAVVAVGDHSDPAKAWPDALTASAFGAATARPVLFVTLDRLPPATASALAGARDAVLVGGERAIGRPVAELLTTFVEGAVRRVHGDDRYGTSVALAEALLARDGAELDWVWAATGADWADAAAAGAAVSRSGDVLVLVDPAARGGDAATGRWLWGRGGELHSALVLGGERAVPGAAAARLARRIT